MEINREPCHGISECLERGSGRNVMSPLLKIHQKLRSYLVWWVENLGWRAAIKHVLQRVFKPTSYVKNRPLVSRANIKEHSDNGILGLQPGELVEVKSVEEIMETLDNDRRNKGLRWMTGMRKHCGKQYRVLKRLDRIMLEDSGELRNMKNTVLLEGVFCDGKEFGNCDRCCFHFWRETWLKRVSES